MKRLPDVVEHSYRGLEFSVGPRTPRPGIGWKIHHTDSIGRKSPIESQGAFYDDVPEGAYAAAESACRRYIDKALE